MRHNWSPAWGVVFFMSGSLWMLLCALSDKCWVGFSCISWSGASSRIQLLCTHANWPGSPAASAHSHGGGSSRGAGWAFELSFPHKQDKLHFFASRQDTGVTEFFPHIALFLFLRSTCFFPETSVFCVVIISADFKKLTIPWLVIKLWSGNDLTQSPCCFTMKNGLSSPFSPPPLYWQRCRYCHGPHTNTHGCKERSKYLGGNCSRRTLRLCHLAALDHCLLRLTMDAGSSCFCLLCHPSAKACQFHYHASVTRMRRRPGMPKAERQCIYRRARLWITWWRSGARLGCVYSRHKGTITRPRTLRKHVHLRASTQTHNLSYTHMHSHKRLCSRSLR